MHNCDYCGQRFRQLIVGQRFCCRDCSDRRHVAGAPTGSGVVSIILQHPGGDTRYLKTAADVNFRSLEVFEAEHAQMLAEEAQPVESDPFWRRGR